MTLYKFIYYNNYKTYIIIKLNNKIFKLRYNFFKNIKNNKNLIIKLY